MQTVIFSSAAELVRYAATHAAESLRRALAAKPLARLVAATGSSQIEFLAALIAAPGIDWPRVELFHLDEYIGLGEDHPASFRRFLQDRLIVPAKIQRTHLLDGLADPATVARDVGRALAAAPVDLLLCGIGENGHLAFNDPPADFDTADPYLIVALDEACRRQQVGEGWFPAIDAVPSRAISMSIRQILAASEIICVVHGARKAEAIAKCFGGGISNLAPASILRTHRRATLYVDTAATTSISAMAGRDPAWANHVTPAATQSNSTR